MIEYSCGACQEEIESLRDRVRELEADKDRRMAIMREMAQRLRAVYEGDEWAISIEEMREWDREAGGDE
jgi:uncharacterized protein with ATP-grasp and redox domains